MKSDIARIFFVLFLAFGFSGPVFALETAEVICLHQDSITENTYMISILKNNDDGSRKAFVQVYADGGYQDLAVLKIRRMDHYPQANVYIYRGPDITLTYVHPDNSGETQFVVEDDQYEFRGMSCNRY